MTGVKGLGYVVAESTVLSQWREYAVDIHGFQPVVDDAERLRLRLDERMWRLEITAGDTDAIVTLGWEVASAAALDDLTEDLKTGGYQVTEGTTDECRHRQVTRLVWFADPDGTRVELFVGQAVTTAPFRSPTGATFELGDLGLGHVMAVVSDATKFWDLYVGILGFELTDYVDVGPEPGIFLHCNERHHSMAFAGIPGVAPRIAHLMIQSTDLDFVGRAYDELNEKGYEIGSSFGRHSNDAMISYYAKTPGKAWELEFGYGGRRVGPDWTPVRWDHAHLWGHHRAGAGARMPGGIVVPPTEAS